MKKSILLFTFLLTILSSCEKDDNKNTEECYSNNNAQSIVHDGVNREYVLYIPNSYDGTSSVPLMLNFHGFGSSASDYMQEADMRSLAEADTFILIYPQGSCLDGLSHWNACPTGGDNKSTADDFGFVEAKLIVSRQNLKGWADWRVYIKSENFPERIPKYPNETYKNDWIDMNDFLGYNKTKP